MGSVGSLERESPGELRNMEVLQGGWAEEEEDYDCPICHDVLKTPIRTKSCRHVFCRECFRSAVTAQGPHCPMCRGPVSETEKRAADVQQQMRRKLGTCRACGTKWILSKMRVHYKNCQKYKEEYGSFDTTPLPVTSASCENVPRPLAVTPVTWENVPTPLAVTPVTWENVPRPLAVTPVTWENVPTPLAVTPVTWENVPVPVDAMRMTGNLPVFPSQLPRSIERPRALPPNPGWVYSCPYCPLHGLTDMALVQHCVSSHRGESSPMVCPICVTTSWGDVSYHSRNLIGHLAIRHRFSYHAYMNVLEEEDTQLYLAIQQSTLQRMGLTRRR